MKDKKKQFFIGIDIGGTKISSALFSADAEMIHKKKIFIDKNTPDEPVHQIYDLIKGYQKWCDKNSADILSVGIVIPGVVFHKQGLVWAPNIKGWDHFPLQEKLQHGFDYPLIFDSDRSGYVLGEQWAGKAKGYKDIVYLAVGTGIGAGMILDGRLYQGCEDIAGAVGWFALTPDFKSEYAEMGCFEAEASGQSIEKKARDLIESGKESRIAGMVAHDFSKITAETVIRASQENDLLAKEILVKALKFLAMGMANIVSILNPEIIILGGGLFKSGHILIDQIKNEYKRWAQPLAAEKVKIELSGLGEDAGLYGAGKLAKSFF